MSPALFLLYNLRQGLSCPNWACTHYVAQASLELAILLPQLLNSTGDTCLHHQAYLENFPHSFPGWLGKRNGRAVAEWLVWSQAQGACRELDVAREGMITRSHLQLRLLFR